MIYRLIVLEILLLMIVISDMLKKYSIEFLIFMQDFLRGKIFNIEIDLYSQRNNQESL